MALPTYNDRINLEEALSQFDYATSQLVLHPLNKDTGDTYKRREHILEAATDANNASSRLILAIEKNTKDNISNKYLSERYLSDISACIRKLKEIGYWYSRLEEKENESQESDDIKGIKRERNIIESYINLMGVRKFLVGKIKRNR